MAENEGGEGAGEGQETGAGEGGGGAGQEAQVNGPGHWLGEADSDLRAWAENKGFATPAAAMSSYRNLERVFGADKAERAVVMPTEDASPEEMAAFYTKLGRPSDPADYEIPMPEAGGDPAFADAARGKFHELGLSAKQATELTNWWNETAGAAATTQLEAYTASVQKDETALRTEWGAAYDKTVGAAKSAAAALGATAEQIEGMEKAMGFGDTMRFFANVASKMGEASFETGGSDGSAAARTPAQAQAQLQALMADKPFMEAWSNRNHPGHKAAVERKSALMAMAHPS